MPPTPKIKIIYVTKSEFKIKENIAFARTCQLHDGRLVGDVFDFVIQSVDIKEVLDVELTEIVSAEVKQAYRKLRVPCIVEHAGLIFEDYLAFSYPGGLTKPMWNALGEHFVRETHSKGRRATARAVVAYCDGQSVRTFVGERTGIIADEPKGEAHKFYWDTVFMPDDPSERASGKTYAEIVEDAALGLNYKMGELSQSSIAMLKFLEHLLAEGPPPLWGRFL
jgi:XTP/dITP diphosphohydrolase